MSAIVIFSFLVIFALLLFSIGFGLRFHESRRRVKLISMLRTVTSSAGEERHVNLLIDPEERRNKSKSVPGSGGLSESLIKLLTESGVGWSLNRFLITSGFAFVAGAVGASLVPYNADPFMLALLGGCVTAGLPFFYLRKKRAKLGECCWQHFRVLRRRTART